MIPNSEHASLIKKGSVKNIYKPKLSEQELVFEYSDRVSVFDWGPLPEEIENKGICLNLITQKLFDVVLPIEGMRSHLIGNCDQDLRLTSRPGALMKVMKVDVLKPELKKQEQGDFFDYSCYNVNPLPQKALVPLEVIFRFSLPQGSSLLKRANDPNYLKSLGLSQVPKVGQEFAKPVTEFSTKLEPQDRFLSYPEAKKIAGLSELEFEKLKQSISDLAQKLKKFFSSLNIELADGKFELAFDHFDQNSRGFILVDSLTPDELRLNYKGVSLSKQLLRDYYQKTSWYEKVLSIKEECLQKNISDWKSYGKERFAEDFLPPKMPEDLRRNFSLLYQALTNRILGNQVFKGIVDLDQAVNFFT